MPKKIAYMHSLGITVWQKKVGHFIANFHRSRCLSKEDLFYS
ncbi:MAG TPA: hypothetical protein PKW18_11475 [Candidatus Sumerlaeota bacterium]|nr:hypothetical protein [Candidatus Sumerlaeota bacterium]